MGKNILVRNNVKVSGSGTKYMLFGHGFGCDQTMWQTVAKTFEDDYKVVLFDYVGSGKSELEAFDHEKYSTLTGYAQDVLDICAELGVENCIFVGHSVSTMIGIIASTIEPHRFERLLLVGPSPYYLNDPPTYYGGFEREDLLGLINLMERNYIGWAKLFAPTVINNPDRPELEEVLEESFCSTDPVIAKQFAWTTFFSDCRSVLKKVTVPSLILQSAEDIIAPVEVGQYVHQHLPNSSIAYMDATGHCPHMSHPEETIFHIREYLAQPLNVIQSQER